MTKTQEYLQYCTWKEETICVTSPFKITKNKTIVVNWIEHTIEVYNKNGKLLKTLEEY